MDSSKGDVIKDRAIKMLLGSSLITIQGCEMQVQLGFLAHFVN